MADRKDGMEKWSVENGIFVVCPIEYLAEKLGIEEEEIEAKLGHVHGLLTMQPFSVIRVEKSYLVDKEGSTYPKIELTSEKLLMSDHVIQPVRNLQEDEMLLDEFVQNKNLNNKNQTDLIGQMHKFFIEHENLIKNRTQEIINKE
jgi:hypothetical protein